MPFVYSGQFNHDNFEFINFRDFWGDATTVVLYFFFFKFPTDCKHICFNKTNIYVLHCCQDLFLEISSPSKFLSGGCCARSRISFLYLPKKKPNRSISCRMQVMKLTLNLVGRWGAAPEIPVAPDMLVGSLDIHIYIYCVHTNDFSMSYLLVSYKNLTGTWETVFRPLTRVVGIIVVQYYRAQGVARSICTMLSGGGFQARLRQCNSLGSLTFGYRWSLDWVLHLFHHKQELSYCCTVQSMWLGCCLAVGASKPVLMRRCSSI